MTNLVGTRLGQYEVISAIGRGGMATVYKARQPSMDRDVAIKVISAELQNDPDLIARFEHEARLIARLQHVHILPVYDFGREGDLLYLVMRLVEGGTLDKQMRQGPLSLAQTAHLFTRIASALTYAHKEGVVHRDLKPNNILLDKNGDPYLTDFGLAKILQSSGPALTATGVAMGTPIYMAPEQWRGVNIDARVDIYALGIMLYEMLTGELPFKGETPYVLMYKHFDEMPPLPSQLNPALPPQIDVIINRAMAKNREARFSSADQMAEALNIAVAGGALPAPTASTQPVMPPPDEAPTLVEEMPSPKPPPKASLATTVAPAPTEVNRPALLNKKWLPLMGALGFVAVLLIGLGLYALAAQKLPYHQLLTLTGHTNWIHSITWSPDGTKLASASVDQTVRIWDEKTGESLAVLRGHTSAIYAVRWSPDGTEIASASEDGAIRIWNAATGVTRVTLETGDKDYPISLAWSPDGATLASGYAVGSVRLWDRVNGKLLATYPAEAKLFTPVAWTPDGKKLASGAKDNSVELWDVETGQSIALFAAHNVPVRSLSWNRDGSRLATCSYDHTVLTWNMLARQPVPIITINEAQAGGVSSAVWSPDGTKLATSGGFINLGGVNDMTARVWDAETGKLLATLEGHSQPVSEVAWSPDGSKLVTCGFDNIIHIWGR